MPFRGDRKLSGLAPVLVGAQKVKYYSLAVIWFSGALWFWSWWLLPEHVGDPGRYVLVSVLIAWVTLLQVYFLFFLLRMVRSTAPDPVPGRWRVAMVVTKTPSEPWAVVRRTLEAMLAQDYPHDTWLADEDPAPETLAWCTTRGVRISCRKGREDYHRKTWPRRTRCKEGNLAFFYDHWGYENYDIVSQLDADHVPQPGYLKEMLRPFDDPKVGYVSAPSICASNAGENWAARTRLDTEGPFHGAIQAGYSNGFAPMCIGSHYAVRTKALKAVGGLGPELAEDHSTSLLLNSGGWRGVHAIDAIAIGDGPATIGDMVTQEFQWSRSLLTLLLQHTFRYLPGLPWRLKAQFLFCQLFYPITALTMLAMFLLPISAVLFDIRYAEVTWPAYVGHAAWPVIAMIAIAFEISHDGLFRPTGARVLSWEKALFVLLQWPWVFLGCAMAVRDWMTGRFVDFRITPKGEAAKGRLPEKVLAAYAGLSAMCLIPVILRGGLLRAEGFYLLTMINGLLYAAVTLVTISRHQTEIGRSAVKDLLVQATVCVVLVAGSGFALQLRALESLYALTIGLEQVQLVRPAYAAAGAGKGMRKIHYVFDPKLGR